MKLKAYSIYDRKSLIYNTPFFSHTDAMATRSFSDAVNDRNAAIFNHPNDYVMYLVGEYDDQTGQLVPQVPLIHISDATPLVRETKQPDFFSVMRRPADVSSTNVNGEDK